MTDRRISGLFFLAAVLSLGEAQGQDITIRTVAHVHTAYSAHQAPDMRATLQLASDSGIEAVIFADDAAVVVHQISICAAGRRRCAYGDIRCAAAGCRDDAAGNRYRRAVWLQATKLQGCAGCAGNRAGIRIKTAKPEQGV